MQVSVSDVVVSQAKKNVGIFQLQWELRSPSGRCAPIILCTYEDVAAERQKKTGDKVCASADAPACFETFFSINIPLIEEFFQNLTVSAAVCAV